MLVVVAEKFFMARSLARAIFGRDMPANRGAFLGEVDHVKTAITWAEGHLLGLAEPDVYNPAWQEWRLDDLPVAPPELNFKLEPRADEQLRLVTGWLKAASAVVNACDAAREGELIFDEIARWCGVYERKLPVRRLWISDTTAAGLRKAWQSQIEGEDRKLRILREQARARSECDWLWGINLTRYASLTLAPQLTFKSRMVSVGRVRSPVMAMIAERTREVYTHEPIDFFQGHITFCNEDGERCEAKLLAPPEWKFGLRDTDWSHRDPLDDRLRFIRQSLDTPWAVIEGDNRKAFEYPPPPFDLTDLQRTASRLLQWSAQRTNRAAQSLYAKFGAITYPRTDCSKLPVTMRDEVLDLWRSFWYSWLPQQHPRALTHLPEWEPDEHEHFADKISDHHGIIPTGADPPTRNKTTGELTDEYQLWDLIVRRFITAWLPPAQVFASSRAFTMPYQAGEHLRALVKAGPIIEPAWLKFEDLIGTTRGFERKLTSRLTDTLLPKFTPTVLAEKLHLALRSTSKPEFYSYDGLLFEMEKLHLGTPATRGEQLAELISLGYVQEDNSGLLVITEDGERIVQLLREHGGSDLLDPKLTAFWEKQLERIGKPGETGRKRLDLVRDILDQIRALGDQMRQTKPTEQLVFCPKTGLRVTAYDDHWEFPGWKGLRCLKVILSRKMKASEFRDILSGGRKGSGPYGGFISRKTKNPFTSWLVYNKAENRFVFDLKR